MAEYATDVVEEADIEAATGDIKYTYARTSHATVTAAQRATLRQAALDGGWTALRAAWVAIDSRAGVWLDDHEPAARTALLRQIKRAPVPAT